jgi:hypothetical protein
MPTTTIVIIASLIGAFTTLTLTLARTDRRATDTQTQAPSRRRRPF